MRWHRAHHRSPHAAMPQGIAHPPCDLQGRLRRALARRRPRYVAPPRYLRPEMPPEHPPNRTHARPAPESRASDDPERLALQVGRAIPIGLALAAAHPAHSRPRELATRAQVRAGVNALDAQQREQARLEWLARPATLAFPDHHLPVIRELAGHGYDLVDAQAAFLAGDTAAVRRILDVAATARVANAPEDRTVDVLFPEASLRAAIGDVRGAIAWLDPTLSALARTPPQSLGDPARAGCLIRAMALRARLAASLGDSQTATLWSRPLRILRPSSN